MFQNAISTSDSETGLENAGSAEAGPLVQHVSVSHEGFCLREIKEKCISCDSYYRYPLWDAGLNNLV
jgi:hypothetical protein